MPLRLLKRREKSRLHPTRVLFVHFIPLFLSHFYNPAASWLLSLHLVPLSTFLLSPNPTYESITIRLCWNFAIRGYLSNSSYLFRTSTSFLAPFPTLFLACDPFNSTMASILLQNPYPHLYFTSNFHPTLASIFQSNYLTFCFVPILLYLCPHSTLLTILISIFCLHCWVLHTIQSSHESWRSRDTRVALFLIRSRVLLLLVLFLSFISYHITWFQIITIAAR